MIHDYEKFRVQDISGKNHMEWEVNWPGCPEEGKNAQLIKITFHDGKRSIVNTHHLNALLFAIGDPETQKKMVPQRLITTKWYRTVIGVKATKDIHKGEEIVVPVQFPLPSEEEEIIGEIKAKKGQIIRNNKIIA